MKCISCNNMHEENYCPHCGEKKNVKRITFPSMFQYAISSIIDMDKGFLFNVKSLFTNPKKIITNYILGKRKDILNPISFLIFSITIYLIIETFLKVPVKKSTITNVDREGLEKIAYFGGRFIRVYFKYFWVFTLIPLSFLTRILFQKYNYSEHLAINSFILGQITLIGILSHLIFREPIIIDPVIYIALILYIYIVFKNKNDKVETAILSFFTIFLFILMMLGIIFTLGYLS
ncbi:DUF3667 domain-containing protein [Tenacibaculum aiptasiae]|uniref:DUF3667 domain-containing protein n=1 Tax=Tenacibaculum aiptasiae TaxID=426481 RepID=UPI003B58E52C